MLDLATKKKNHRKIAAADMTQKEELRLPIQSIHSKHEDEARGGKVTVIAIYHFLKHCFGNPWYVMIMLKKHLIKDCHSLGRKVYTFSFM